MDHVTVHGSQVVRIKHVDLEGRVRMTTLKVDLKYWPTYRLSRTAGGDWERIDNDLGADRES